MKYFQLNKDIWRVQTVRPNDRRLMDRTGKVTVATTDPHAFTIYISEELYGSYKRRVLIHEIGHCALISFKLIDDIHRVVAPRYWVIAEEWVCNFIADFGEKIFEAYESAYGEYALRLIPRKLEQQLIA